MPQYIGVYLGKDKYYAGFQGKLKGWNWCVGNGSFRTENFTEF